MNRAIKTLIIDDHPVFRQGLRQVIESQGRFQVIAEAEDGRTGLALIDQVAAELIVLDINLPGLGGLDVVRALRDRNKEVRVVILTMHREEAVFNAALNLNVKGYVLKDSAAQDILTCLQAVAGGDYYFTPSLSAFFVRRRDRAEQLATGQPGLERLTTAERRILQKVAEHQSNKDIARALGISVRTVESHRANITAKLNLQGSQRLAQFAVEHRLEL